MMLSFYLTAIFQTIFQGAVSLNGLCTLFCTLYAGHFYDLIYEVCRLNENKDIPVIDLRCNKR